MSFASICLKQIPSEEIQLAKENQSASEEQNQLAEENKSAASEEQIQSDVSEEQNQLAASEEQNQSDVSEEQYSRNDEDGNPDAYLDGINRYMQWVAM